MQCNSIKKRQSRMKMEMRQNNFLLLTFLESMSRRRRRIAHKRRCLTLIYKLARSIHANRRRLVISNTVPRSNTNFKLCPFSNHVSSNSFAFHRVLGLFTVKPVECTSTGTWPLPTPAPPRLAPLQSSPNNPPPRPLPNLLVRIYTQTLPFALAASSASEGRHRSPAPCRFGGRVIYFLSM